MVLETLKKWEVAITSVRQGYESMEGQYDYWTETETTYGERGLPIDIRKLNNNFKDRKLKCLKHIDTQHETAKNQRKKKTLINAISMEKSDTQPRIARQR